MKRFIEGEDRHQVTLLPECLDDYIGEDNRLFLQKIRTQSARSGAKSGRAITIGVKSAEKSLCFYTDSTLPSRSSSGRWSTEKGTIGMEPSELARQTI